MKFPKPLQNTGGMRVAGVVFLALVLGALGARFGVPGLITTGPNMVYAEEAVAYLTVEGVLQFVPPPDLTICFCGSYFVRTEKDELVYLASDEIDISDYINDKVSVTGRPFVTACMGTLYQTCNFIRVVSLEPVSPAPTEPSTWGRIKSLFR